MQSGSQIPSAISQKMFECNIDAKTYYSQYEKLKKLGLTPALINQAILHAGSKTSVDTLAKLFSKLINAGFSAEQIVKVSSRFGGSLNLEAVLTYYKSLMGYGFSAEDIVNIADQNGGQNNLQLVDNKAAELLEVGFTVTEITNISSRRSGGDSIAMLNMMKRELMELSFTPTQLTGIIISPQGVTLLQHLYNNRVMIRNNNVNPISIMMSINSRNSSKQTIEKIKLILNTKTAVPTQSLVSSHQVTQIKLADNYRRETVVPTEYPVDTEKQAAASEMKLTIPYTSEREVNTLNFGSLDNDNFINLEFSLPIADEMGDWPTGQPYTGEHSPSQLILSPSSMEYLSRNAPDNQFGASTFFDWLNSNTDSNVITEKRPSDDIESGNNKRQKINDSESHDNDANSDIRSIVTSNPLTMFSSGSSEIQPPILPTMSAEIQNVQPIHPAKIIIQEAENTLLNVLSKYIH